MNSSWPTHIKLGYAAICLVGTALVMWGVAVWIGRPFQDWIRLRAADWPPEVTFGLVFVVLPILWVLGYRYGRKHGWI